MNSEIPEGNRSIDRLPSATQSKIRSTQILTSLPQIVSELIQNSVDAGAKQVDIGVDCEEWECWVRDDGAGIKKDDLATLAKGGRYKTSKAYSPSSLAEVNTFGFRGEALISAADLSCLEIASRTAKSRESWSIILKGGQALYEGPSLRWRRESAGTVVCIRDAFYNLPVRKLSHPCPQKTLELIRKEVETFALISPEVSFSLENATRTGGVRPDKSRIMSVPKTKSTLATFRHLFGRAFAEHVDEINEKLNEISIEGFISLEGAHSRGLQYLYLNRHRLSPCDLQRLIEQKFAMSSFGKHAFDEHGETSERPSTRRSPRKSEKRPVYVLNITVPQGQVDNCLEPAKNAAQLSNMDDVMDFLASIVQSFLVRHGFTPGSLQKAHLLASRPESPTPRKKRKFGREESIGSLGPKLNNMNLLTPPNSQKSTDVRHAQVIDREPPVIHPDNGTSDSGDIVWTDPQTGVKFVVDQRTGNSRHFNELPDQDDSDVENIGREGNKRWTLKSLSKSTRDDTCAEAPQWIRDAMGANNAFMLNEPMIPSLNLSTLLSSISGGHSFCDTHSYTRWKDVLAGIQDSNQSSRFGKDALRDAVVLGQVDKKFIACTVDPPDPSDHYDEQGDCERGTNKGKTLVLIDQHAADERVRVEKFLKDLCSGFLNHRLTDERCSADEGTGEVEIRSLKPSYPVLLTRHEATQIAKSTDLQKTLERWGFQFSDLEKCQLPAVDDPTEDDSQRKPPSSGYIQLLASSVPEILADKLVVGDELRSVLKGFISHLDLTGHPGSQLPPPSQPRDDKFMWQRAMRWCPKELLDLVNSKACRGAIMFNDPLTSEQCQRLVLQLADTSFPFQCAHGRPSLVPLTNTGNYPTYEGAHSARGIKPLDWTRMFAA